MADTHTSINEGVEVTLKLKVKITRASYYGERTQEQLDEEIAQAKVRVKEELLNMVVDEYSYQELSDGKVGYVKFDYEVKSVE